MAEDELHREDAGAGVPAAPSGAEAFERQVGAIAAERGLNPSQVAGAGTLANMPDVTPAAFGAIVGIFDCLFDADVDADPETPARADGGNDG